MERLAAASFAGRSGGEFSPQKVIIDEKKAVALCNCKHSDNKPFCDGTHAKL